MEASCSQVIEQCRNCTWVEQEGSGESRGQRPIEPRDVEWLRLGVETAQHLRPEVALEFSVFHWTERLFQKRLDFLFAFLVGHFAVHKTIVPLAAAATPSELSFLRNRRTARNTRTFTSASEMPAASAISQYGSSSISARVATRRYFAGNSRNARRSWPRSSPRTAESPCGAAG